MAGKPMGSGLRQRNLRPVRGVARRAVALPPRARHKTQKRVNALKFNIIPRYQATVQHIRAALEEDERNTLFQIKVLRARQGS